MMESSAAIPVTFFVVRRIFFNPYSRHSNANFMENRETLRLKKKNCKAQKKNSSQNLFRATAGAWLK